MDFLTKTFSFIYKNLFPLILENKLIFFGYILYICFALYHSRHLTTYIRFKFVLKSALVMFLFQIVRLIAKSL